MQAKRTKNISRNRALTRVSPLTFIWGSYLSRYQNGQIEQIFNIKYSMLPNIPDKKIFCEPKSYHSFMKDALHPSHLENNITKLKRIKLFLDEDNDQVDNQQKHLSVPKTKTIIEKRQPTAKSARSKENRRVRRKSFTANSIPTHDKEHEDENQENQENKKRSIFAVPEKLKLNELLKQNHQKFMKQLQWEIGLGSINTKLRTNRIL